MAKSSRGRVSAAAPFAFRPPLVDPPHAKAARDKTLDLMHWAAYSLGYQIGRMPFVLELTRTVPQYGSDCFDAIPSSASVMRLACDLLSSVMPTGVASQIREAANDLEEFNNDAARTFHESGQFCWDIAAGNYLADRFPVLIRGALHNNSYLLPWLHLGHSLGEFISNDPAPPGHDAVPFRPVVDAARSLPSAERNRLPELRELAALVDRPESEGEAGLRRAYVVSLAANWLLEEVDPWPNSPFFTQEIETLHRRIDEHLLSRREPAAVQEADHVPRWDRATGKLMFSGKVIRKVVARASKIREILDLFQSQKWPVSVETKYSGDSKKDVVESLNEKLSVIEFCRSGTKNGIGWKRKGSR